MATNAKIMKGGNSVAMRIPHSTAKRLALKAGTNVEIDDEPSKITIRIPRARVNRVSLDSLLKGVSPSTVTRDCEWDEAVAVGREVW